MAQKILRNISNILGIVELVLPNGQKKRFQTAKEALAFYDKHYKGTGKVIVKTNSYKLTKKTRRSVPKKLSAPLTVVTTLKKLPKLELPRLELTVQRPTSFFEEYVEAPIKTAVADFYENDPIFGKRRVENYQTAFDSNPEYMKAMTEAGNEAGYIATLPVAVAGAGETAFGLAYNIVPTLIGLGTSYAATDLTNNAISSYTPYSGFGNMIDNVTNGGIPYYVADTYNPITWGSGWLGTRFSSNVPTGVRNFRASGYNSTLQPVRWAPNGELVYPGEAVSIYEYAPGTLGRTYFGSSVANNNAGAVRGGRYLVRPRVLHGASTNGSRGRVATKYTTTAAPYGDYPNLDIVTGVPLFTPPDTVPTLPPTPEMRLELEVHEIGDEVYEWYKKLPTGAILVCPVNGKLYYIDRSQPDRMVRQVAPIEATTSTQYSGRVIPDSSTVRVGSTKLILSPRAIQGGVLGNPELSRDELIIVDR